MLELLQAFIPIHDTTFGVISSKNSCPGNPYNEQQNFHPIEPVISNV
jgi:hypothetical protein